MKGTQADGAKRGDLTRTWEEVEELSAELDRRERLTTTSSGMLAADLGVSELAPLKLYVWL